MTAKLIKGEKLTPAQIREVKAAFGYRWTFENEGRALAFMKDHAPTVALVTDEQWINEHAFYFTKAGRLALRPNHCEPVYMAD